MNTNIEKMNNRTKYSELSDEDLLKDEKRFKSLLGAQITLILLLLIISVLITIRNGFGIFSLSPIFFILFMIPMLISLKGIKEERKARNI
ncbi:hypothetical protein [Chryseobacterium sp.]|uniref:hypothetical protein n=1 Tax=Chryseobacterium sp. TaxID=1871047 RepID=UPI0025BB42FF|nr:hypothetical protein [Chryseobacterium sp.]